MDSARQSQVHGFKVIATIAVARRIAHAISDWIAIIVCVKAHKQREWTRRLQCDNAAQLEVAQERALRRIGGKVCNKPVPRILIGVGALQVALRVGLRRAYKRDKRAVIQRV